MTHLTSTSRSASPRVVSLTIANELTDGHRRTPVRGIEPLDDRRASQTVAKAKLTFDDADARYIVANESPWKNAKLAQHPGRLRFAEARQVVRRQPGSTRLPAHADIHEEAA